MNNLPAGSQNPLQPLLCVGPICTDSTATNGIVNTRLSQDAKQLRSVEHAPCDSHRTVRGRYASGQIQERAEKMRLVQGVVVGAVRLRDVLTRDRGQQGLE